MDRVPYLLRDRRLRLLVAACAVAVAAAGLWLVPARAAITGVQDGGKLVLTSTAANATLFAIEGLVPGEQATARITLGNDGARAGDLALRLTDRTDRPGLGGAVLSDALDVTVRDAATDALLFAGRLSALTAQELGRLGAGAERTFAITVALPDGGTPPTRTTGDNALQGAKVTWGMHWGLTEDAPPPPAVVTTPPPAAPSVIAVGASSTSLAQVTPRRCVSRRSFRIRIRQRSGDPVRSAQVLVNGRRVRTVRGRRLTAPIDLRGLPKGTATVRIVARTRSGRRLVGQRRYLTCAPTRRSGPPVL